MKSGDAMSPDRREYLEAWDPDSEWAKKAAAMGIFPDWAEQNGPVVRDGDEHDAFATIAAPESDRYFDEPEEDADQSDLSPVAAILKILVIVTDSKLPRHRLTADCILAMITGTDKLAGKVIAGKHGVTPEDVQERITDIRCGKIDALTSRGLMCKNTTPIREVGAGESILLTLQLLDKMCPKYRVQVACIMAAINRVDDAKSLADIGRKHGLTRAAVSKRKREICKHDLNGLLSCYFFGGRPDQSHKSRERATRVHEMVKTHNNKHKCKTIKSLVDNL